MRIYDTCVRINAFNRLFNMHAWKSHVVAIAILFFSTSSSSSSTLSLSFLPFLRFFGVVQCSNSSTIWGHRRLPLRSSSSFMMQKRWICVYFGSIYHEVHGILYNYMDGLKWTFYTTASSSSTSTLYHTSPHTHCKCPVWMFVFRRSDTPLTRTMLLSLSGNL